MRRYRIAYFVYDLADQAVPRRIAQFEEGGADVILFGYSRLAEPPTEIAGLPAICLGRTRESNFVDRALAVLRALACTSKWRRLAQGADAVVGRNLECLAVAAAMRLRVPLVYEILDVHRLLVDRGPRGRLLRLVEGRLIARCSLVMTSSPAFLRKHLARYRRLPTVLLVENKVIDTAAQPTALPPPARPTTGPWRIGWFGRLRCRRSLAFLRELVTVMDGRVEVELRGTVDLPLRGTLDAVVASTPHMRYHGVYRHADLPEIYGAVHFSWAIDFFEEGLNSSWLLPNRLYEGCANGAIPIALSEVETGRWLKGRGIGLICETLAEIHAAMGLMNPEKYLTLVAELEKLPRTLFLADEAEATHIVSSVIGIATANPSHALCGHPVSMKSG